MRAIRIFLPSALLTFCLTVSAAETSRYIVATTEGAHRSLKALTADIAELPEREVREFKFVNAFAADLTADEAAELRHAKGVRYVQPVHTISINDGSSGAPALQVEPTGTRYAFEQTVPWGIDRVRARDAWVASRGAGVHVAVLDTGIDRTHPDLVGHVAGSFDAFGKDPQARDDNFHGTHVSGTIAANDNDIGVVGVAPQAELWAVKVLNHLGNGTEETLLAGLEFVIQKKQEIGGNWIINLSLGADTSTDILAETFARVIREGILVVASAGNDSKPVVEYPAHYDSVVAVGSTDSADARSKFSNYGTGLILTAPGTGVLSTMPVGSIPVTDVTLADGTVLTAAPLTGSPKGEITGKFVFCGLGRPEDFPSDVAGNIAVVRRGEIYFRDKGRNAKAAGASALVIIDDERNQWPSWTLMPPECDGAGNCNPTEEDLKFPWPLTVGMSQASGEQLLAKGAPLVVSYRFEDYGSKNGTSMSAPHVTGAAALLWSLAPTATAEQIRTALKLTARDLGPRDWDPTYGYGVVDVLAGAKFVAPAAFGLPPNPPLENPRRNSVRH